MLEGNKLNTSNVLSLTCKTVLQPKASLNVSLQSTKNPCHVVQSKLYNKNLTGLLVIPKISSGPRVY